MIARKSELEYWVRRSRRTGPTSVLQWSITCCWQIINDAILPTAAKCMYVYRKRTNKEIMEELEGKHILGHIKMVGTHTGKNQRNMKERS